MTSSSKLSIFSSGPVLLLSLPFTSQHSAAFIIFLPFTFLFRLRQMLPQVHPPHIDIPKYIPDYSSHLLSRPKLPSSTFFLDISHLVPTSISPSQSHSPTDTVDDEIPSPHSPGSSGNYHYVYRGSGSFDSPISPTEMYPQPSQYQSSHSFKSAPPSDDRYPVTNSAAVMNEPQADPVTHYHSDSPSPADVRPTSPRFAPVLHQPHAVPASYRLRGDRFNAPSDPRTRDDVAEYSSSDDSQHTLLDHRRMSEPAILSTTNSYASQTDIAHSNRLQPFNFNPPALNPPRSSGPAYIPSLHRGTSIGSLRDVRDSQYEMSPSTHRVSWKEGDSRRDDSLDTPISPLQPNFTSSLESPTSALQFSPGAENYYGPSPPNTGTSTSSAQRSSHDVERSPRDPSSKTYSFVALPGNAVKKRPRRRYDEIERLYHCAWPDCTKAYGTLNHLNAHVTMQKHGLKRSPNGKHCLIYASLCAPSSKIYAVD